MFVLLVGIVVVAGAGGVGFLLGYLLGRRSAAKQRQAGFPVLKPANESIDHHKGAESA